MSQARVSPYPWNALESVSRAGARRAAAARRAVQAVLDVPFNGTLIVKNGTNSNWGLVNHDKINKAMAAAEKVAGAAAREKAWAAIDKELVEEAVAVPYDWTKQANVRSNDVAGVGDTWNVGSFDFNFTSLK